MSRSDQVVEAEADLGAKFRHDFLVVVLEFLGELRLRIVKILRATTDPHKGALQEIQGLLVALPGVEVLDLLQLWIRSCLAPYVRPVWKSTGESGAR